MGGLESRRAGLANLTRLLVPPILALQSLLAVLALFDAFRVRYHATIQGNIHTRTFSLSFSLTPVLLLFSIITIAYLLMRRRYRELFLSLSISMALFHLLGPDVSTALASIFLLAATLWDSGRYEDYAFWILALLTGLEGTALLHWITLPLGIASPLAGLADLEHALFAFSATLAPLLTILTLCMWIIKPIARPRLRAVRKFFISRLNVDTKFKGEKIGLNPWALLALSLVVAAVGALYPYSPNINPTSKPFGRDIKNYVNMMVPVEQEPSSAFRVSGGSRTILLLTMYALKQLFKLETLKVVKYLPVLLNPLLTLSVYFMVSKASGDNEWAGLASLFTALGFKVTVGMYSYFLANDLCLILIFSALGFLFKSLRTENRSFPVAASALASLAVFTHPWTLTQFCAPIVLLGFILGYRHFKGERSGNLFTILIFLSVVGLIDVLKGITMGGLEVYGAMTSTVPYQLRIDIFWKNNIFTFRNMYMGYLSNSLLLGLSALGVHKLNHKKIYPFFLEILLSISSVYYLINHVMFRGPLLNLIPARILYNIPCGVLTAIAILSLLRNINLKRRIRITTLIFVTLYMTVYLLRSLANLI